MIATDDQGNDLAALQGQNRNGFKPLEAEAALIVDDGPGGFEGGYRSFLTPRAPGLFPIRLNDFNGLGDGTNRQLSTQVKILPNLSVHLLLKLKFVENFVFESEARKYIARLVKVVHGIQQNLPLFRGWKQFGFQGFQHISSISLIDIFVQYRKEMQKEEKSIGHAPQGLFLPVINGEASALFGEILAKTRFPLQASGYAVQILNLIQPELSQKYNPLAKIQTALEIGELARILIRSAQMDKGDPFWHFGAEQLLEVAIHGDLNRKSEANLSQVLALLQRILEPETQKQLSLNLPSQVQNQLTSLLSANPRVLSSFHAVALNSLKMLN